MRLGRISFTALALLGLGVIGVRGLMRGAERETLAAREQSTSSSRLANHRSNGGLTPSGWRCEHMPYLVEIDNWGVSRQPGEAKAGGIWIWGYDEITWFAHQSKEYRAKWLQYAWDWLRDTDTNAHLQMPGSRTATSSDTRWYFANNQSDTVPNGSGDEAAIRAVWVNDTARLNK